jgi:hypothetical protein
MISFLVNVSFTDMLSILNDSQKAIVETITMRLDTKQSLEYLKEHGYDMNERTYFRQKKKNQSLKLKRLYHIAKVGFVEQHLERIEQIQLIQQLMWKEYDACKDAYQRSKILISIVSIQPYLSAYYEATHYVAKEAGDKNIVP